MQLTAVINETNRYGAVMHVCIGNDMYERANDVGLQYWALPDERYELSQCHGKPLRHLGEVLIDDKRPIKVQGVRPVATHMRCGECNVGYLIVEFLASSEYPANVVTYVRYHPDTIDIPYTPAPGIGSWLDEATRAFRNA